MITNARIVGIDTNPADYHSVESDNGRGTAGFVVSFSALKEFARCASRWRSGYVSPESEAKNWGALVDTILTSPKVFQKRFAVKPATYADTKTGAIKPWNGNSLVCKAWLAAHAEYNLISEVEHVDALTAVARLREDEVVSAFVDASDKQVRLSGQWRDEVTGLVVPLKAMLDFVPRNDTEFNKCLGDLKEVRNAALIPFQRQVFKLGWHLQAAFYMDLYLAAVDGREDRNTYCFIVQENYPPWQSAKRMLSQDFLDFGRAEYRRHLEHYCACLAAKRWPGYDDNDEAVQGWSVVRPEPWMQQAALYAPRFDFGEEEPTPTHEMEDTLA